MNFEKFYQATENAFAGEKEDMLNRVQAQKDCWKEAIELDLSCQAKTAELSQLKTLLSKGAIQVMRIREEALRVELEIVEINHNVQKLQSEIYRFLPATHKGDPSIEHRINVTPTSTADKKERKQKYDPTDEQFEKELSAIKDKWKELSKLQESVFQEENEKRKIDDACFKTFCVDYEQQNKVTHQLIAQQMKSLIDRTIATQNSTQQKLVEDKSKLESLERRKESAEEKMHTLLTTSTETAIAEREKVQQNAANHCGKVRDKIRKIERQNMAHYQLMNDKGSMLHREENILKDEVGRLQKKYDRLRCQNDGFVQEARKRIEKLEGQLNALVSAVSAIPSYPADEHRKIMNTISAAIGEHAIAVESAENVSQMLNNMKSKIQGLCINQIDP